MGTQRKVVVGGAGVAVAALALGVLSLRGGDATERTVPATWSTTPTSADDGPVTEVTGTEPDSGDLARFDATPLCDGAAEVTAPRVGAGEALVSAIVVLDDCLRPSYEAVPVSDAAKRAVELNEQPHVVSAVVEQPTRDVGTELSAGPVRSGAQNEDQWALAALRLDEVWERTKGAGVDVGILELWYDAAHEDLGEHVGYTKLRGPANDAGHGTHVTGIISADDNGFGVTGVAPESGQLFVARTAPDLDSQIAAAIAVRLAVDHGAKVLNLSFFTGTIADSSREDMRHIETALRYAGSKDVVVAIANGNCGAHKSPDARCPQGHDTLYFPQVLATVSGDWNDHLITVGSTDRDDHVSAFSTRLIAPRLAAPGQDIRSTLPDGYGLSSGTSMAAPQVSGVAALLRASHPNLSAVQVAAILEATARDIGDKAAGAGVIDPVAAMTEADRLAPADVELSVDQVGERIGDALMPGDSCFAGPEEGWLSSAPIQLHGGEGEAYAPDGEFAGASMTDVAMVGSGDFDGDGDDDAVITASCFGSPIAMCCAGRSSILTVVLPVDVINDEVRLLAPALYGGKSGEEWRKIYKVQVAGDTVVTDEMLIYPEHTSNVAVGHDANAMLVVTWGVRDGAWVELDVQAPQAVGRSPEDAVTLFARAMNSGDVEAARKVAEQDVIDEVRQFVGGADIAETPVLPCVSVGDVSTACTLSAGGRHFEVILSWGELGEYWISGTRF